jgi:HlyD family secretion protein
MTANVRMLVDQVSGALRIPNAALRYRPSTAVLPTGGRVHAAGFPNSKQVQAEATVWVLDQSGTPRPARVKIGISDGNYTAVESSELNEGDAIVLAEANGKTAKPAANAPRMRGPGF